MKRIFTILCALVIVMTGSATALASANTDRGSSYCLISLEAYTYGSFDELRINKTYQLPLTDDPSLIPTEDFVRNGRRYYLLDITREDEVFKADCAMAIYTAIFGSETGGADHTNVVETPKEPVDLSGLKSPLIIGGLVLVMAVGGMFVFKKIKEQKC